MARMVDGVPAVVAAFHWENGKPCGGAVIEAAPRACLEDYHKGHVFLLAKGDRGDGRLCLCGQFRRRVYQECPTCHREDVAVAERVA